MHPNEHGAQLPPTQCPLSGESTSHSIWDTTTCMSFQRLRCVTFKSHVPSILPASVCPAFQGSITRPPTRQASACPWTPPLPRTPSLFPPRSWGTPPPTQDLDLHHFLRDHRGANHPHFSPGQLLAERQPEAQVPAHRPDSGQMRHLVTQGSQQRGPGLRFSVQPATSHILLTPPEPALHTLASLVLPLPSPAVPCLPLWV